ncbi:tetratricopeptide repeat protein [bacterium]|nr:tetratricopeptide repeat protein [bacterium]
MIVSTAFGMYRASAMAVAAIAAIILMGCATQDTGPVEEWQQLRDEAQSYFCEWKIGSAINSESQAYDLAKEEFGEDDLRTAEILHGLAQLHRAHGDDEVAEELYHRALRLFEEHYTADDPELAQILANMAQMYADREDFEQAEAYADRSFAIREKAFGPDSPEVGQNYFLYSYIRLSEERINEAEELALRCFELRKPLGDDNESLCDELGHLATVYEFQDRYEEALELRKRAVALYEDEIAIVYPDGYINVLNGLVNTELMLGMNEEAEEHLLKALEIAQDFFGPSDAHTAEEMVGIAEVHTFVIKSDQAKDWIGKAMEAVGKAFDPNSPEYSAMHWKLEQMRSSLDDSEGALELANEWLEHAREKYETDGDARGMIIAHDAVAGALIRLKRRDETILHLEKMLKFQEIHYGANHSEVGMTHLLLACHSLLKGDKTRVEQEVAWVRAVWMTAPIDENLERVEQLQPYIRYFESQGRHDVVALILTRIVAVYDEILGPTDEKTFETLSDLTEAYSNDGDMEGALDVLKDVVARRRESPGKYQIKMISAMDDLASYYDWLDMYEESEPIYRDEIDLLTANVGPEDSWTADAWNNLGYSLWLQDKDEEAEEAYKKSIAIYDSISQDTRGRRASPTYNLALLYEYHDRAEDAERCFMQCLAMEEGELGPDHPEVAATLRSIATFYRNLGRDAEAEEFDQRATNIDGEE